MARVVVVGAGMGGLAAAARLAALGHDVVVVERAGSVGGKLGRLSRDGFSFDTGPSLLTLPAVYRDLFLKTGAPLEDMVELVPVHPTCRYRFADGTWFDLPNADPVTVGAAMDDALGAGAGAQWTALMTRAGAMWDATRVPFVESAPRFGALARRALSPRTVSTIAPWSTLRDLGRRHLADPRLRVLLDRYATYTGSDPRQAPAVLATIPYVEQTFGAWYVTGGLRRLGDAVHQRAVDRGAVVVTGTEVESVVVEGGRAAGVRLADGHLLPADVVVVNADASQLYGSMLRDATTPATRRVAGRMRGASPSSSGLVLMLALRGRTPDLRQHTVLFPDDYDAEFDAVFGVGRDAGSPRPPDAPTVYVSAPDDPALRPDDDHEAWFVLVTAPRHRPGAGVDWDSRGMADAQADRVLALMAARGLDVRDRVLWREVRTPADLERDTGAPGGAIYGTSSNGAAAAFRRPANRSPVPGLFLVGGSAHPGGGLPLVGLSAAIVAGQVGPA